MADKEIPLSPKSPPVKYSFVPGEIVSPGTKLSLRCNVGVDLNSDVAGQAVAIHQHRQQCEVSVSVDHDETEKCSTIHISTENLKCGAYQVEIGHLCDTEGKTICEPTSVPVTIGAFKGKIPDSLRVEHVVYSAVHDLGCRRLKAGEAAPEGCQYIEFVKCVDRKTCKVEHLAFDENGEQVDGQERLSAISKRRLEEYGCLHPILSKLCHKTRDTQPLDIIIIPRISECAKAFAQFKKPTDKHVSQPPQEELEYFKKVKEARAKVVSALDETAIVEELADSASPLMAYFIFARLTAKQIKALSKSEDIGGVFLKNDTAVPDLADSLAISRANQAHAAPLGYSGAGVNVAVYEDGPSDTSQLEYASQYNTAPPASDHARLTSAIIKNRQQNGPQGYAPNCLLHSANSRDVKAVDWAARTKGCTVISQSFHRVVPLDPFDEQTVGTLSFDDVLKDWLAVHWPYPTIVHAAGNDIPNLEYVNHKGFNTISVGSHTDNASLMNDFSVFKNPISPRMDRELPEITANGDAVSAIGQIGQSGTSFAAPAVAGSVALMQEASPTLKSWPEGCRAILFASADRNIRGGTWWNDVSNGIDAWDGAGALNAEGACEIARSPQQPGNPAAQFGWGVRNLTSDDIGPDSLSKFRYSILVPTSPFTLFRYTVKVALAFSSTVTPDATIPIWGGISETSDLNINLDLIVRNSSGVQVANSSSFDNSYEICEFSSRPGERYEIIIRRNSGTRNVFMGVAWGVWRRLWIPTPIPPPWTNPVRPIPRPPLPDPPPPFGPLGPLGPRPGPIPGPLGRGVGGT